TNKVKMANSKQYATLLNEKTGSTTIDPNDIKANTDWYGEILHKAFVQNHEISARGGTDKGTYNLSLGYLDQQGIIKGNDYKRVTARFSNDWQLKEPLKIGYNVTAYGFKSNDIPINVVYQ